MTTLKLSEKLKSRREERMLTFVREARAADVAITDGANIYRTEDVHSWLERIAARHDSPRPKPWRK